MRDAFSSALKLLLAVFLLAVGVAALDLRVIQPFRTPPCNPETLEGISPSIKGSAGRSAVAAAAYRSGTKLTNEIGRAHV